MKNKNDIEFDGEEEGNGDHDDGGGDGDLRDNTLVKVKHMKKAAAYLS